VTMDKVITNNEPVYEEQIETNKSVYENENITFKEKFAYGLGDGATAFAAISVASFSMYYFTDYIGVSASILGAILFFSRFFDAATNVLMGFLVDKTKSKHGKARPWILWTIIPFALTLVLSFTIPTGWGDTATLIYIAIIVNVYFLMYTASNIPYGTLGSLVSRSQTVRGDMNVLRMLSYFVMSIILGAVTIPLVEFFGGETISWTYVMIIYAILMSLMFLFTFRNTKERVVQVSTEAVETEKLSLGKSLKLVLTNKYWIILFFVILFAWSLLFMLNSVNVYYAEYILGEANYVGALNAYFTGGLIAGFLIISLLMRKIGRRTTIIIGLVVLIISSMVMLFDTTSLLLIGMSSVIRGLGFAPIMGTAYAMLADVIDYGEWKNGVRNEGLTFAGGTFATTVGTGLASGGVGLFLGANGYIGSEDVQPAAVYDAITGLFITTPAILGVLLLILFYFYNLDTFYKDIVRDIKNRA